MPIKQRKLNTEVVMKDGRIAYNPFSVRDKVQIDGKGIVWEVANYSPLHVQVQRKVNYLDDDGEYKFEFHFIDLKSADAQRLFKAGE